MLFIRKYEKITFLTLLTLLLTIITVMEVLNIAYRDLSFSLVESITLIIYLLRLMGLFYIL